MKSQTFQFQDYSPIEFEQFRNSIQQDGFTVTQNTIDTVSGHIGSLTYITGNYNRNQRLLHVEVKSSPWSSFPDEDLKANVMRISQRDKSAEEAGQTPVNKVPVKTPPTPQGSGYTQPPVKSTPVAAPTPKAPANPIEGTQPPANPAVGSVSDPNADKSGAPQEVGLKTETPVEGTQPSVDPNSKAVPKQTPIPAQGKDAANTPTS